MQPTPRRSRSATSPRRRSPGWSRPQADDRIAAGVLLDIGTSEVLRRGRRRRLPRHCRPHHGGHARRRWATRSSCWTHHHVREDAQALYGFATRDERACFEALLGAHGVGPALALAILSVHTPRAAAGAGRGRRRRPVPRSRRRAEDRGPPARRAALADSTSPRSSRRGRQRQRPRRPAPPADVRAALRASATAPRRSATPSATARRRRQRVAAQGGAAPPRLRPRG